MGFNLENGIASSKPNQYYPWESLPVWGTQTTLDFNVSKTGVASTVLAPYSQPWNNGYDATASKLNTKAFAALQAKSNSNVCDGTYKMPVWINQVQMGFGVNGSKAQSRATRDFYPHDFILPEFTLSGQTSDVSNYGQLSEFIHYAQHHQLGLIPSVKRPLMQFYLQPTQYINMQGNSGSTNGVTVKLSNKSTEFYPNEKIVGPHMEILCRGYVSSFKRIHTSGDFRPAWQMTFETVHMIKGPWHDTIASDGAANTWVDILKQTQSVKFGGKGNMAQNKKVLSYAQANSANVSNAIS